MASKRLKQISIPTKTMKRVVGDNGWHGACILLVLLSYACAVHSDAQDDDAARPDESANQLKLWLTISARKRFLEVSWTNAPAHDDDNILLTEQEPYTFKKLDLPAGTPLAAYDNGEGTGYVPLNGPIRTKTAAAVLLSDISDSSSEEHKSADRIAVTANANAPRQFWTCNDGKNDIVAGIKPGSTTQWFTTGVYFDYGLSRNVTTNTSCYGYWASYINGSGAILAKTCIRAYPRWMNDLRSVIGGLRLRDLFIPGTHDSGSYRPFFDPLLKETLVTKYALTQDDDIRGQLLHGARYLDIRVGYYRNTQERFFINHGITKQRPLIEIIEQVKDFVLETNEIIIFGLKEFPVGFGHDLGVHRLLVSFLREQFDNLIVHPSVTWSASLREMWQRHQNIILAYDEPAIVHEFPQLLFGGVEQRWGNVQTWARLERYLHSVNGFDVTRITSRPLADMAELTPDTWGVILDKYGGLRKMADNINWRISQLYREQLGDRANIVAVDFIRGTILMDIAIDWNKRKVIS